MLIYVKNTFGKISANSKLTLLILIQQICRQEKSQNKTKYPYIFRLNLLKKIP